MFIDLTNYVRCILILLSEECIAHHVRGQFLVELYQCTSEGLI